MEGTFCAILFAAAVLGYGSLLFLKNARDFGFKGNWHASVMGYFGVCLFGTMLILSIAMIVSYFRNSFTVRGDTLRIRTLFRSLEFWAPDITALTWKNRQAIRLRTKAQAVTVDLKQFEPADVLRSFEVVDVLRLLKVRPVGATSVTLWRYHFVRAGVRDDQGPYITIRPRFPNNHEFS